MIAVFALLVLGADPSLVDGRRVEASPKASRHVIESSSTAAPRVAPTADDGSCLARMARQPAGDAPTFRTERECELWEVVEILEGELETATTALDLARTSRAELVELVDRAARVEPQALGGPWPLLWRAAGAGLGAAGGAVIGGALDRESSLAASAVGALVGAVVGVLLLEAP